MLIEGIIENKQYAVLKWFSKHGYTHLIDYSKYHIHTVIDMNRYDFLDWFVNEGDISHPLRTYVKTIIEIQSLQVKQSIDNSLATTQLN